MMKAGTNSTDAAFIQGIQLIQDLHNSKHELSESEKRREFWHDIWNISYDERMALRRDADNDHKIIRNLQAEIKQLTDENDELRMMIHDLICKLYMA